MKSMRKIIAALLTACLLGTAACTSQPAPAGSAGSAEGPEDPAGIAAIPQVRISVDMGGLGSDALYQVLQGLPGCNQEFLPIIESVPYEGTERDACLTRLRTELMAGAGPDMFVCRADVGKEAPLFPFPRQAMKNRLFLPLDGYIADARYMEWDHLQPAVMEAGANEEGQQILPLVYELPVMGFPTERYPFSGEVPWSRQEMLESGEPVIRFAAHNGPQFADVTGRLVDHDREEPAFTEEELLDYVLARREDLFRRLEGEYPDFTFYWDEGSPLYKGYAVNHDICCSANWFGLMADAPIDTVDYTLVPLCSREGGVTATIRDYMAINRNTEVPRQAFRIMDYLMSDEVQKDSFVLGLTGGGLTPNMELGRLTEAGSRYLQNGRGMNGCNWAQLKEIEKHISVVEFGTAANGAAWPDGLELADRSLTDEDIARALHESYMELKMMLAES